jgi:hypothetical protein
MHEAIPIETTAMKHRSAFVTIVGAALLLAAACSSEMPSAPAPTVPGPSTPPAPTPAPPAASQTARYRVTFQSTWTRSSHPVDFPSNAHFSPLVGGTHDARVRFWSEGNPASAGIRDMAERGRTSPLDSEVQSAIAAGTAARVLIGGAIDSTPGGVTLDFDVDQTHSLVTLVSMVAPSPDWFVGVSALPLFENGAWMDQRRVDLVPWDAGTDSGATFTSPDSVTTPPQPVFRIVSAPLSPSGNVTLLGTFTFTRLSP